MNQPLKVQEPSMEEILASIRRIIADDDAAKPPAKIPEPVAPPAAVPPPSASPMPPLRAPAARSEPSPNAAVLDDVLARMRAPAAQAPAAVTDHASDVVESTEKTAGPTIPAAPGFQTIDGQSDIVLDDREPGQTSQPAAPPEAPRIAFQGRGERPLMSPAPSAAVDSAFNALAHTVLVQNARTLEDLVREMLQPLLKTWLDDNLPELVERLVRTEIERLSRGRG
jgi:cell pole-organizing protein PopZ